MNHQKLMFRSLGFVSLLLVLFSVLTLTLYSIQIIYGNEYAQQSERKQPAVETIDVARGAILDRYGRVLVSNEVSYQVKVDLKSLGTGEEREEILQRLLEISKQEAVYWIDTLNISKAEPFEYTTDLIFFYETTDGNGQQVKSLTRLGNLATQLKWMDDPRDFRSEEPPTAEEMLDIMAEAFEITESDPVIRRQLVGIVYELMIRDQGIYWDDYVFAQGVGVDFTVKVKENQLSGIEVEPITTRVYGTDYAAHLLGRIASQSATEWEHYKTLGGYGYNDLVGKEGVELAFESWLKGEDGIRVIETNAEGYVTSSLWEQEPLPGGNVVLTLDIDLQKNVEDTLDSIISRTSNQNIQGASCVLVEVDSGAVLAAGSYPTFNLATYSEDFAQNSTDPLKPLMNRAFQGLYAPGSTFKMITSIAGLEEGIVSPTTTIRCAGTYDFYEPNGPACWIYNQFRGSHGLQSVSEAVKNSCNYYFYEVGRQLGIERIGEYANKFGLGVATGMELFESPGVMAGPEYTESRGGIWYDGATLSASIGQESSQFTPLQLANYIATLANGGTYHEAHLLQEVKSGDFRSITTEHDVEKNSEDLGLDPANVAAILKGMQDLTVSGSVSSEFARLRSLGISVGAKTGTAQLTNVAADMANSVFVCFAPFDKPEIAVAVVVEQGGGSNEAALIAAEVIEQYFEYQSSREVSIVEKSFVP